jgi:propanediol utilization protein
MNLSSKHIHMNHLNHVDLKAQNYGLYEKKNLTRCGHYCL